MDFFEQLAPDRDRENLIKAVSSIPSNYVGGKRRMLRTILTTLEEEGIKYNSVFDAFSGSAIVSLLFKIMGKTTVSNDLLTSSALTAVCLLENSSIPLSDEEINFLCHNVPNNQRHFTLENYKDKFFTEKECNFLDRYRRNVEIMCGDKFYCGLDLINKATLSSIPNSNFSVYGNLSALRNVHDQDKSFWTEKWRDTTRKRRDENNEIKFTQAVEEIKNKYKSAFSLFALESQINQYCFVGGRYYNGQIVGKMEHRINHDRNKGKELDEQPFSLSEFKNVLKNGESCVFNSDIISLLEADIIKTDLLYLDPPYGGGSSDYTTLYKFLEEYLYEDKIENLDHIKSCGKRFSKNKGYQEQFELLLSLSKNFKTWMISYNDSSWADLDTIKSIIKNNGKTNIKVVNCNYTYQYRKGKNIVDVEHFMNNYTEEGHKYEQRGVEYLILAE